MRRVLVFLILLLTFTRPSLAGSVLIGSLTFDDLGLGGGTASSGTYNSNDTFSFDVLLTFSENGGDVTGLSFWLETNTAFAGSLSVTGVTYGTTFVDPNAVTPNPASFTSGSGASPAYLAEDRDLGSTGDPTMPAPPGTYFVAHITFTIAGAMPGTYDLVSTTTSPKASSVICDDTSLSCFEFANLAATHYSVTIVPEPATVGLLSLGAAGLAAVLLRRRKRAGHALSRQ